MIGVFDSGLGGLCSLSELQKRMPREDKIYLADRKNLPYGTKSEKELLPLVGRDISRLRDYGCRKILIACCTASTLYPLLSEEDRKICIPIIFPAAIAAAGGKKTTVIATERTVKSRAFSRAISELSDSSVTEIPAGELVLLAESGEADGCLTKRGEETLSSVAKRVLFSEADTLILGYTHFSHFEGSLSELLPGVKIVSAAREGAVALVERAGCLFERGRVAYTEN